MRLHNIKELKNADVTDFHKLIGIAHRSAKPDEVIPPEDYLVVNLYIDGIAKYKAGNNEHLIKPNYITITHPNEDHQLLLPPNYKQCTLIYTPQYISNFIASLSQPIQSLLDNPNNPRRESLTFENTVITEKWDTVALVRNIYELMQDIAQDHLSILAEICFQEALLSIMKNEYIFRHQKSQMGQKLRKGIKEEIADRIQKAIEFINDYYNQEISLQQLSDITNLSRFHFTRTFKQVTGLSPYQYITQRRIENAKMYLKNSHLSITEVAYEVGFTNPTSFYKFFLKITGVSPSEFRKG